MKKRTFFYLTLLCVIFTAGCSNKLSNIKDGDMIFYNPIDMNFIDYNPETNNHEVIRNADDTYQFYVVGSLGLYIDTDTKNNESRLIEIKDNKVKEIFRVGEGEGIYPIEVFNNNLYFIHTFYNKSGKEDLDKRRIALMNLDDLTIRDFTKTQGASSYGAVNKDFLYYTLYEKASDTYKLMRLDLVDEDYQVAPEKIKDNLSDGEVLLDGNTLFYANKSKLISDKATFDKKYFNYITKGYLIQLYTNENGDLSLEISNLSNLKSFKAENIIGIKQNQDSIEYLTDKGVKSYELKYWG